MKKNNEMATELFVYFFDENTPNFDDIVILLQLFFIFLDGFKFWSIKQLVKKKIIKTEDNMKSARPNSKSHQNMQVDYIYQRKQKKVSSRDCLNSTKAHLINDVQHNSTKG